MTALEMLAELQRLHARYVCPTPEERIINPAGRRRDVERFAREQIPWLIQLGEEGALLAEIDRTCPDAHFNLFVDSDETGDDRCCATLMFERSDTDRHTHGPTRLDALRALVLGAHSEKSAVSRRTAEALGRTGLTVDEVAKRWRNRCDELEDRLLLMERRHEEDQGWLEGTRSKLRESERRVAELEARLEPKRQPSQEAKRPPRMYFDTALNTPEGREMSLDVLRTQASVVRLADKIRSSEVDVWLAYARRHVNSFPLGSRASELITRVQKGGALCCEAGLRFLAKVVDPLWAAVINEWAYSRLSCSHYAVREDTREHLDKLTHWLANGPSDEDLLVHTSLDQPDDER